MGKIFNGFKSFWNNLTTSGAGHLLSMEQRRRVVFLNSASLFGMMILLAFAINRYLGKDINTAVADISAFGFLLIIFFYMRIRKKFLFAGYAIVICIFLLFSFLVWDGGGDKSSSLWVQTFPLVAIFILGLTPGIIFSLLYFVLACCFVFIPDISKVDYGFNFGLRIIGSYTLVFIFALFYENARRETQEKLEKISSDLLAAKKETDSIMANVKEGIFLLDSNLNLSSEYSKELESIFGESNLENRPFISLIEKRIDDKILNATQDYLEMFFKPEINPQLLEEINPLEKVELNFVQTDSGFLTKHLEFIFAPIVREPGKLNILGTVKDITEEVELARELKAQETRNKKRMESLFQIINIGPDMLNEFIIDSEVEIENVNKILKSDEKDYTFIVNSIYQSVHAIKGNAILLGLTHFSERVHQIEDEINQVKTKTLNWNELLQLTIRLTVIKNEINEIKSLMKKVLAFQSLREGKKIEQKDLLLNAVRRTIEVMSKEMGKNIMLVSDNFDSTIVSINHRKTVKDILVQLTRNAVSHGIETPEQRIAAFKEKSGHIYISTFKEDGKLCIVFKDDGMGLDLKRIREKAKTLDIFRKRDLDKMSDGKILGLIFHPGFTTAEDTTMSSGRGIGMNFVKSIVEKNGGNLKVKSARGKYCEFFITLPL